MNYNLVDEVLQNKRGISNYIPMYPQFANQDGPTNQLYSMDGLKQVQSVKNNDSFQFRSSSMQQDKIQQIVKAEQKFLKLLNLLINDQNNPKRNEFPFVLPYTNGMLYVHFDPKLTKKRSNRTLNDQVMKKEDQHLATALREPLKYSDIRVNNSLDSRHHQFTRQPFQYGNNPYDHMNMSMIQYTPKPMFYNPQLQPLLHSNLMSPMNSFAPMMISQSFDPHINLRERDTLQQSHDRSYNKIDLVKSYDGLLFNKKPEQIVFQPKQDEIKVEFIQNFLTQSSNINEIIPPLLSKKDAEFVGKVTKKQSKQYIEEELVNDLSLQEEEEIEMPKLQLKIKKSNNKSSLPNTSQDQSDSFRVLPKQKHSILNDTKNITKNFSKAIISFIIQNKDIGLMIMNNDVGMYEEFIGILKERKRSMTNIKQLRDLWTDTNPDMKIQQFNRAFRIISKYFLQKQSVSYVYNSRISNAGWHLKYRQNLLRALKNPESFKFIKEI